MNTCFHGNKLSLATNFLGASLLYIGENFKDKDHLIITWKNYYDKQVLQLSQSNWSNQFSITNGTYLASQLMG